MIRFSKLLKFYLSVIFITITISIASLVFLRLKPSIDFTGGSLIEFQPAIPIEETVISETLKMKSISDFIIQQSQNNSFIIRTATLTQNQVEEIKGALIENTGQDIKELRFETVGPVLGKELIYKTITAVSIAILVILFYIAWSFKDLQYGFAAVFALLHDLLVLLGSFALLGYLKGIEVDSLFVTAVLTTTSFSVHDTIVVFHKIRELIKQYPGYSFAEICDRALTETMVRSINNSLTIIFMLLALVILGGETIRYFAVALLIGTVTGTYSSPFVATPLLIFVKRLKQKKLLL